MPLKIIYLLVRRMLGLAVLMSRSDLAKDAELLGRRHETAVLRRHAGRVLYGPGRPAVARRAGTAHTPQALGLDLPDYASDAAGLAPQAGRGQIRHQQAAHARPPADRPGHRPPRSPPGEGESAMGTPPHPRRTDEARRDGRTVHCLGDPACCG